jgi:hypothetical protein
MPLGGPGMLEPSPPGDESLAIHQNDGNAIALFSQNAPHNNNMEITEIVIGTNRQSIQRKLLRSSS